ncbi:site-2 protease family protein, partial [bacterium]|nr:site-2 protease family protein [bacterium]
MNFLIGWTLFAVVYVIGTAPAIVVQDVREGSPAESAGIVPGDIVRGFPSVREFTAFMRARGGSSVGITIERAGKEIVVAATPRKDAPENEGALGVLVADVGVAKEPPLRAVGSGFTAAASLARDTGVAFYSIIKTILFTAAVPEGVVGPVGIFSVAKSAGAAGAVPFLWLVGLISVNLFVLNLIPFPALDGGRFLLILIEKLKGSPVSRRIELWINGLGFAALILLMIVITVRDVGRL